MALRRVSAVFMNDDDLRVAEEIMTTPIVSGHLIVGDVDEDRIKTLREAGLFIHRVDPESGPDVPPPPTEPTAGGELAAELPEVDADSPQLPEEVDFYMVAVAGPLLPDWARTLAETGGEIIERVVDSTYACRMSLDSVSRVAELPFVSDLRLFRAADALSEPALPVTAQPADDAEGIAEPLEVPPAPMPELGGVEIVADGPEVKEVYDVILRTADGADAVSAWLADHGVPVVGAGGRKFRIEVVVGSGEPNALARLPEVALVDPWVPPTLSNDHARVLLGVDAAAGQPAVSWTGRGQRVGVADSGIDVAHPDLSGRVVQTFALGVPGDFHDRHGHGTHVAGSIAGSGAEIKGVAPEAELVFQSIMDAKLGLSGLPVDLGDLFEQARAEGVFIHNNSWGALAGGAYRSTSLEVDTYVYDHPEVLVVFAAGNKATAHDPRNVQPGHVDLFSIDAPATAKNALTVGASRSNRVLDPALTWGMFDPARFADAPIGDALVTGDPSGLAAFSGRGPCLELARIKPDVVAPGTFILSTRASTAPDVSFWRLRDQLYAYMGGTSMATPLVTGCAALVRQYLVQDRGHQPSAALLKAILVNGTRWLGGPDAIADHATEPNFHQGFGMVDLHTTLPGNGLQRLEFVDGWQSDDAGLAFTGDARTFLFTHRGGPMRMCLTWTDLPGRGVQNNVALLVRHDQSGQRLSGNPGRRREFDTDDAGNNVQVIRWDDAPSGSYVVQVTAANLLPRVAGQPERPQHFALAVSGDLDSALTSV